MGNNVRPGKRRLSLDTIAAETASKRTKSSADAKSKERINSTIGEMAPGILADYLFTRTAKFEPDLTLLEREERRIPGKC